MLVDSDPVLQKPPTAIDNLCSRLHNDLFVGLRDIVGHDLDILWVLPDELAIALHALLGMNHFVVNDTINFGLVGPGRIRVENNLPVLEKFGPKGLPLGAPDCSGPWCSLHSELRLQPGE